MKIVLKKFYVGLSKIHNKGIFAFRDIKKEEIISRFKGPIKFKINRNKRDALLHPDWVGITKDHWMDPERPQKFFNHSCNPNASIKGRIFIESIKNIRKDEEITFDYSTIEGDLRWEMKCKCKEKNCRKIIKSIQFLPKRQIIKYMPYIPAYFKNLYIKNHTTMVKTT